MDPNPIPTTDVVAATNEEDQSSKTTTEETDHISNEIMGSGRSYECVFCKRGFTTAQALGGHMNIHRKDRVKTKPNTPSKPEHFNNHHSTLRPTTTAATTTISHHQSFQTYFPTSSTWCLGTTTATPPHDHQFSYVHSNNNPQVLNTLKDQNWTTTNMSLASRSLPTLASTDRQDKRSDGNGGNDDDDDNDDELDLELRLGHDR